MVMTKIGWNGQTRQRRILNTKLRITSTGAKVGRYYSNGELRNAIREMLPLT